MTRTGISSSLHKSFSGSRCFLQNLAGQRGGGLLQSELLGHFHHVGLEAPLARPPGALGSGGVLAFRAAPALDDARLAEIMPAFDGKRLLEVAQADGASDSPLQSFQGTPGSHGWKGKGGRDAGCTGLLRRVFSCTSARLCSCAKRSQRQGGLFHWALGRLDLRARKRLSGRGLEGFLPH